MLSRGAHSICWPSKQHSLLQQSVVCLAAICFLATAARVVIPLHPVPLTFQSAAIILTGMVLGPRLAGTAVAGYLAAGFAGLPVFAPGAHLLMNAGYLASFLPAAIVSGWLAQQGFARSTLRAFTAACAGCALIFIGGLAVLSQFTGWQTAIAVGLMPFAVTEPLKLLAISLIIPRIWRQ